MHHLMFVMKRSFHRALSKGKPLVAELDLTPARFDLMFVLFTARMRHPDMYTPETPVTQKEIRRALGVSRETVSHMLKSLEDKGFIRRKPSDRRHGRDGRDGRTRTVELTDVGRAVIRRAAKIVHPRGVLADPFTPRRDPLHEEFVRASSDVQVDELWGRLRGIAARLGDFATLEYPTLHPDD